MGRKKITRSRMNNYLVFIDSDRFAKDDLDSIDPEEVYPFLSNYIKVVSTGTEDPKRHVYGNYSKVNYQKSPFIDPDDKFSNHYREIAPRINLNYSIYPPNDLVGFHKEKFSPKTIEHLIRQEMFELVRACFLEAGYVVGGIIIAVKNVRVSITGSPYGNKPTPYPITVSYYIEMFAQLDKNITIFTW